jgi:hypothetical protein
MSGTFLCPSSCGFAKVGALEIVRSCSLPKDKGESNTKYQARLKLEQYKQYISHFSENTDPVSTAEDRFSISFLQFVKKLPGLREKLKKWSGRRAEENSRYLEKFSLKNWQLLTLARKREHSFANCKGCAVRYADVQSLFPVKSPFLKGKSKLNPVFAAETEAQRLNRTPEVKPLQSNIKNAAKAIDDKIDLMFNTLAQLLQGHCQKSQS